MRGGAHVEAWHRLSAARGAGRRAAPVARTAWRAGGSRRRAKPPNEAMKLTSALPERRFCGGRLGGARAAPARGGLVRRAVGRSQLIASVRRTGADGPSGCWEHSGSGGAWWLGSFRVRLPTNGGGNGWPDEGWCVRRGVAPSFCRARRRTARGACGPYGLESGRLEKESEAAEPGDEADERLARARVLLG